MNSKVYFFCLTPTDYGVFITPLGITGETPVFSFFFGAPYPLRKTGS